MAASSIEPCDSIARCWSMNWKRIVARSISEGSALTRSLFGSRLGFRILLYHAVGTPLEHDTYGISVRPELFERHMQVLAEADGLTVVDIYAKQMSASLLRVAVTFDDGYKDTLNVAAPILLKYKIPFTVFVSSSFLQSKSTLYLTQSDLRELAALPGVTIGSHGANHIPLACCDDTTLWHEVDESRRAIEDIIGKQVAGIAYPHGSANVRVRNAARRAGYTFGVCSRFDINDAGRDPLLLCRSEVVAGDSERVLLQKLCGSWDWYRWRTRDPALQ